MRSLIKVLLPKPETCVSWTGLVCRLRLNLRTGPSWPSPGLGARVAQSLGASGRAGAAGRDRRRWPDCCAALRPRPRLQNPGATSGPPGVRPSHTQPGAASRRRGHGVAVRANPLAADPKACDIDPAGTWRIQLGNGVVGQRRQSGRPGGPLGFQTRPRCGSGHDPSGTGSGLTRYQQRRVMGAWWPPRSSKPSSARYTGRGKFDSYPLRHFGGARGCPAANGATIGRARLRTGSVGAPAGERDCRGSPPRGHGPATNGWRSRSKGRRRERPSPPCSTVPR